MNEKEIFEIVKYFKKIYTEISIKDINEIYFISNKFFYKKNPHYILYGELLPEEGNKFLEWINGKTFLIKLNELFSIKDSLKKNMVNSVITENEFSITYTNKENIEKIFLLKNDIVIEDINSLKTRIDLIDKSIKYHSDLLQIYLNKDNIISKERTDIKILEIPFKRVLSFVKGSKNKIEFTDELKEGKRYIKLIGENEIMKMIQIFATI